MPPLAVKQLPRQAMQRARQRMGRQTELDWLRGLMLVLMTITHLPTWFSSQPVSHSASCPPPKGSCSCRHTWSGPSTAGTARRHGYTAMRHAIWRRAAKVYAAQVALLVLLFWVLVPFALARRACDHRSRVVLHRAAAYGLRFPHCSSRTTRRCSTSCPCTCCSCCVAAVARIRPRGRAGARCWA